MRLLRTFLLLAIVAVLAVMSYNYLQGRGFVLAYPSEGPLDADTARQRGAELTERAAERAGQAATKLESAVGEGALTAKIKSKMALDDYVRARAIDVDTSGSVVTLSGVVHSADERERAVRLARETAGVAEVVDRLEVRTP